MGAIPAFQGNFLECDGAGQVMLLVRRVRGDDPTVHLLLLPEAILGASDRAEVDIWSGTIAELAATLQDHSHEHAERCGVPHRLTSATHSQLMTPCCARPMMREEEDGSLTPAVMFNEHNEVVQCHACGAVYQPEAPA